MLPALLVAALALPASASADATVSVVAAENAELVSDTHYDHNRIRVDTSSGSITVTESRASELHAGTGCTDAGLVVTCSATGVMRVELRLGPGNDTTLPGTGTLLRQIHGEGDRDHLEGGPGYDQLHGGIADDVLVPSAGDDELHGGDDRDLVDYSGESRSVVATIPRLDSGPITRLGPDESDTIDDDVEDLTGGSARDVLNGNQADNHLVGNGGNDDLVGGVGHDELDGGSGADLFWGGTGHDLLLADDGGADRSILCHDGDDRIDADNGTDSVPADCETIAPEMTSRPTITGGPFKPEGRLFVTVPGATGTAPTGTNADWYVCDADGCLPNDFGPWLHMDLTAGDVGKRIFARLRVSNGAGQDVVDTELTPVIAAQAAPGGPTLRPWGPLPDRRRPIGPRPQRPAPTAEERFAQLSAAIDASLGVLAPHATPANARRLARRKSVKFLYSVSTYGVVGLRWTVPARVARRYGVKATGREPVIVARGSGTGRAGTPAVVGLKATKAGRRILRRATRLRITFTSRFVGGAATKDRPATATRTVALRLRG